MNLWIAPVLLSAATAASACTPALPGGNAAAVRHIDSTQYSLAFRTSPEKIAVGQHFAVEFALCAKPGAAVPHIVRVDAHMPEHRHGMNYRTTVTGNGGKYRAEGLMFHMPGRWEYIFEVRGGGTGSAPERLTTSVVLQ